MSLIEDRMLRDMERAGRAPLTQREYISAIRHMTEFLGRPADQLGPDDIRAWDDEMHRRGHGPDWLGVHVAALRFLYRVTLFRPEMVSFLVARKHRRRIPHVLSEVETSRLLAAFRERRYHVFFSLLFDTGLRISEAAALKAEDIDRAGGLIHVRHGKGGKERQVKLGEAMYHLLRAYWREVRLPRSHPIPLSKESLLFAGHTGGPISIGGAQRALQLALKDAGITKRATPHTLRHGYATSQLDSGTDLKVIQAQLGHADIRTTQIYLHVSTRLIRQAPSPLDALPPP